MELIVLLEACGGLILQTEAIGEAALHDIANRKVVFKDLDFLLLCNITFVIEQNNYWSALES